MNSTSLFAICSLILAAIQLSVGLPQNANIQSQLDQYGFQSVTPGGRKYAQVVSGYNTWQGASTACQSMINGATLFTVNNAEESRWLGQRINFEKDQVNGASKFWIGLTSLSPNGPLQWIDGSAYTHYPQVVQADGYDDETKIYAWAVPDSGETLKYEFLTHDDEAESYICQYLL